jgi:D-alanine transaminase
MPELAYLNGEIIPIEKAFIPIEDRGCQFGDAVYEYIASYNGKIFCMKEHLDRLQDSLDGLAFAKIDLKFIEKTACDMFAKAKFKRAGLYIQISRGVAPRDHSWAKDIKPQILMTIKPVKASSEKLKEDGIRLLTMTDERWDNCNIKTIQLLPNVMAKQKAKDNGADDAIFISKDGIVREGTSSNFFIVKNKTLITHPLTNHILPGVTRNIIIGIAMENKITVEERFFLKEEIFSADEAFLTGTGTEVLGVQMVDNKTIGTGKAGEITRKLFEALRKKAE